MNPTPPTINSPERREAVAKIINNDFGAPGLESFGGRHSLAAKKWERALAKADAILELLAASSGERRAAHPDIAGHTADAVQDACRVHIGRIINSDTAVKIATDIIAKQVSVNAEYAALAPTPATVGEPEV